MAESSIINSIVAKRTAKHWRKRQSSVLKKSYRIFKKSRTASVLVSSSFPSSIVQPGNWQVVPIYLRELEIVWECFKYLQKARVCVEMYFQTFYASFFPVWAQLIISRFSFNWTKLPSRHSIIPRVRISLQSAASPSGKITQSDSLNFPAD